MYNVHRINPQCVLTNITQLPPYWFMSAGEARSAPADPRPQALEPQHWRCAMGASHIRMHLKNKKEKQKNPIKQTKTNNAFTGSARMSVCCWEGRWAVRRGWARDSVVHVQSNLQVFGQRWYHSRARASCNSVPVCRKTHAYLYLLRVEIRRIVKHKVLNHLSGGGGGWSNNYDY